MSLERGGDRIRIREVAGRVLLGKPSRALVLLAAALACGELRAEAGLTVSVDPATRYQTIDGFGASDAWRCQFVGRDWPVEKRERMARLLFSKEMDAEGNPRGIGLSIWRFYLSSGTAEQGRASGIRNVWRRGECFLGADGSYDWDKLAGQRWFLRAAREHGVERFLAFVNAPPVSLSGNGKGYATKGNIHLNLKPGAMGAYADYMAEVMAHFTAEGMPFDDLSPVNEPQWNWDEGNQEGTPALNEEIHELVKELSARLAKRDLKTRIVIGEAGTIGHAALRMDTLGQASDGRDDQARVFFSKESPLYLGDLPGVAPILSAHSYHSVWPVAEQVENRRKVREALSAVDPEPGYWMSEYCVLQPNGEIGGGSRRDLGMDTALYVARIIHHDLAITRARSWQWWTALSQMDYKDGLIHLDDGSRGESGRMGPRAESLQKDGVVRESKLLWTLGNYARFVRPGMTRVKCEVTPAQSPVDGVLATAYRAADGGQVVVLVNLSREERRCDLGSEGEVVTYTTSAVSDLGVGKAEAGEVVVPARAVVTVCRARTGSAE